MSLPRKLPFVINEMISRSDIMEQYNTKDIKSYKKIYIRTKLAVMQNWKCCFCGIKMTEYPGSPNSATLEHIKPKSKGGNNDFLNLAVSCQLCNNSRKNWKNKIYKKYKCEELIPVL